MDLTDSCTDHVVYQTFDDLYRYCYYVASVVGLVSIRIFGYTDPAAEKLAEETGIAFQLTNILRDVREDAEQGRVYLPLEDLRRDHVTVDQLTAIRGARKLTGDERALLKMEADRARAYYAAADKLLPLIARDSRAALWVLVRIYRRLLERIQFARYEVLRPGSASPHRKRSAYYRAGYGWHSGCVFGEGNCRTLLSTSVPQLETDPCTANAFARSQLSAAVSPDCRPPVSLRIPAIAFT